MELPINRLSTLSFAQGFTLWHYNGHPFPPETFLSPTWATPFRHSLAPGDRILVSCGDHCIDCYVLQVVIGEPPDFLHSVTTKVVSSTLGETK